MNRLHSIGLCFLLLVTSAVQARAPAEFRAEPPEIVPVKQWVNSEPLTLEKLLGQVVVLHFWTFGCINCIHNYPAYLDWQKRYAGKKVTIIGMHTPETEGERDIAAVKAKVKENGFTFPVAIDSESANWNAWGNRWWPCVYLIDKQGNCRYRWDGELNWKGAKGELAMRKRIDALLREKE